jgi:undecaprenyl-phosphate 4-deoxy-4-formamido-L-arabinose transferase
MNAIRERISGIRMADQGCMLRGYSREVVDAINRSREVTTFLPALGALYALRATEIPYATKSGTPARRSTRCIG